MEPAERNGTAFEGLHESEESAEEPEMLPDSWETMAEDAAGHESTHESAGVAHRRHACSDCDRAVHNAGFTRWGKEVSP